MYTTYGIAIACTIALGALIIFYVPTAPLGQDAATTTNSGPHFAHTNPSFSFDYPPELKEKRTTENPNVVAF